MKKKVLKFVSILCAAACVLSVVNIVRIQKQYKESEDYYNNLSSIMISNRDYQIYISDNQSGDGEAPVDVNFELLKEMNANVVGWLYCEGTPINYPVVQSSDNSYYLKHLFNNQTNSSGAIFMDALNSPNMTDANTVIYGHNMKNGTMFAALENYRYQSYYEQHPVMYYLTEEKSYRIDIFAAYNDSGVSETYTIFFDSPQTLSDYLQRSWSKSDIDTSSLDMSVNDNIVTLATCTYDFNDARYIVQGKVTPID